MILGNIDSAALANWTARGVFAPLTEYWNADVISMIDYCTSDNKQPSIGLDKYPDDVQNAMIDINNAICTYLAESGYYGDDEIFGSPENTSLFWRVPRESLEQIGKLVEALDVVVDAFCGKFSFR